MNWDTGLNNALVEDPLFSAEVSYMPLAGGSESKRVVVFEAAAQENQRVGSVTKLFGRTVDFPEIARKDAFVIAGSRYTVHDFTQDEGSGTTILVRAE